MAPPDAPTGIDNVQLCCDACKLVRSFDLDEPILGGAALIAWLRTKPGPCPCGSKATATVKAHLVAEGESGKLAREIAETGR